MRFIPPNPKDRVSRVLSSSIVPGMLTPHSLTSSLSVSTSVRPTDIFSTHSSYSLALHSAPRSDDSPYEAQRFRKESEGVLWMGPRGFFEGHAAAARQRLVSSALSIIVCFVLRPSRPCMFPCTLVKAHHSGEACIISFAHSFCCFSDISISHHLWELLDRSCGCMISVAKRGNCINPTADSHTRLILPIQLVHCGHDRDGQRLGYSSG